MYWDYIKNYLVPLCTIIIVVNNVIIPRLKQLYKHLTKKNEELMIVYYATQSGEFKDNILNTHQYSVSRPSAKVSKLS